MVCPSDSPVVDVEAEGVGSAGPDQIVVHYLVDALDPEGVACGDREYVEDRVGGLEQGVAVAERLTEGPGFHSGYDVTPPDQLVGPAIAVPDYGDSSHNSLFSRALDDQ
jgi:hypothetical protein